MLLHRNIVANMMQIRAWINRADPAGAGGRSVTPLPLYHIFALALNCLMFVRCGGEQ